MNKILLIISREYITRVKKRSFILLTFLVPILIAAMYGVVGYILVNQDELSNAKKVCVVDDSGVFKNKFQNTRNILFYYSETALSVTKATFKTSGYDYILHIPVFSNYNPQGIEVISSNQANLNLVSKLSEKIEDILRTRQLLASGIDTSKLNHIKSDITIDTRLLTENGEKNSNRYAAYGIGFLFAFLIYFFIFLYGSQVMRGVIEEKTSRVIEVIISSVKPFELMMGKIIGIALVGVTQFLLWVILSTVVSQAISRIFSVPVQTPMSRMAALQYNAPSKNQHLPETGAAANAAPGGNAVPGGYAAPGGNAAPSGNASASGNAAPSGYAAPGGNAAAAGSNKANTADRENSNQDSLNQDSASDQTAVASNSAHMQAPGATLATQNQQKASGPLATFMNAIQTVNFVFLLACFLFYFITGYLLYGALFAAVGSAVDSETETQQFMLPITLPLIFAFIISVNYVVNFPDAPLSVWLSIIPFFAPVAMMVRLPFNPPVWQIALSMILMIVGFIGTVWVAARVYRIGILMYGKKASFKEMKKWLFYKE